MDRGLLAGWDALDSANAASGVLQLLGFAIAAQSVEVAPLVIIVLIRAYVRVVDGVSIKIAGVVSPKDLCHRSFNKRMTVTASTELGV